MAAFLFAAPGAHAEWIKMGGNDGVDAYMDLKLLQKKDDYVISWRLYDYRSPQKTAQGATFLSATTLVATKCRERTETMLSYVQYDGAMAKGTPIAWRDIPRDEWQISKVARGSIGEALSEVACRRFKMW